MVTVTLTLKVTVTLKVKITVEVTVKGVASTLVSRGNSSWEIQEVTASKFLSRLVDGFIIFHSKAKPKPNFRIQTVRCYDKNTKPFKPYFPLFI